MHLHFYFASFQIFDPSFLQSEGLPSDEMTAFVSLIKLSPTLILNENLLPEDAFNQTLQTPQLLRTKSQLLSSAVAWWHSQQTWIKKLNTLQGFYRGLPPVNARTFESYFINEGVFTMGGVTHLSHSEMVRVWKQAQGHSDPVVAYGPYSIPWQPEFSKSGAWALATSHLMIDRHIHQPLNLKNP